jgi:hypothetical protein
MDPIQQASEPLLAPAAQRLVSTAVPVNSDATEPHPSTQHPTRSGASSAVDSSTQQALGEPEPLLRERRDATATSAARAAAAVGRQTSCPPLDQKTTPAAAIKPPARQVRGSSDKESDTESGGSNGAAGAGGGRAPPPSSGSPRRAAAELHLSPAHSQPPSPPHAAPFRAPAAAAAPPPPPQPAVQVELTPPRPAAAPPAPAALAALRQLYASADGTEPRHSDNGNGGSSRPGHSRAPSNGDALATEYQQLSLFAGEEVGWVGIGADLMVPWCMCMLRKHACMARSMHACSHRA